MHSQLYTATSLALKRYKESKGESREKGMTERSGVVIVTIFIESKDPSQGIYRRNRSHSAHSVTLYSLRFYNRPPS
jgi:hypothetical protein